MGGLGVKIQHFPLTLLFVLLSHYRVSVIIIIIHRDVHRLLLVWDCKKRLAVAVVYRIEGLHRNIKYMRKICATFQHLWLLCFHLWFNHTSLNLSLTHNGNIVLNKSYFSFSWTEYRAVTVTYWIFLLFTFCYFPLDMLVVPALATCLLKARLHRCFSQCINVRTVYVYCCCELKCEVVFMRVCVCVCVFCKVMLQCVIATTCVMCTRICV